MGLIKEGNRGAVLTDIWVTKITRDMDFKIAGTDDGIDCIANGYFKITGITAQLCKWP